MSRAIRAADYDVASLDIMYGLPKPGKQNVMDIMSPSGMGSFADTFRNMFLYLWQRVFLGGGLSSW